MKYSKLLILASSALLILSLSSCTSNPITNLKRSASNKLIDSKGFEGGKRRPLYNKKYIKRAKRNIVTNDYDDEDIDQDEELEVIEPARYNREMYRDMIEEERLERSRLNNRKRGYNLKYSDDEPNLYDTRARISSRGDDKSREQLEEEIGQIKAMLKQTKDEITKSRCPYTSETTQVKGKKSSKIEHIEEDEMPHDSVKPIQKPKEISLPPAKAGSMTAIAN